MNQSGDEPEPVGAAEPTASRDASAFGRALRWLRSPEGIFFLLILVPVIGMRVTYSVTLSDLGADGGYYTNVARHVRDGDGLVTDISVFHQGFAELPHPTPVYPAWPLLFGLVARVVPLPLAATWLPTILSMVGLVFAFLVGRRFAPAPLWSGDGPAPRLPLHGGHLLLAMFAFSPSYLTSTARPYTEALALLGLFAFLWRAPRWLTTAGLVAGFECGLWLAFLLYARSQNVIVILALLVVVAVGLLSDARRVRWLSFLGASLTTLAVAFIPFQRSLDSWLAEPGFGRYLRFDAARAPSALSEVPVMVETSGALAWLVDRAWGLQAAFTWGGRHSYYDGLGAIALAVPVALLGGGLALWRGRAGGRLASWVSTALSPERRWHFLFVMVGLAAVSSLHTVHKVYGDEWAFGQRHSLVAGVGFFMAVVALSRLGGAWALFGFALSVAAVERNAQDSANIIDRQVQAWLKGDRLETELLEVRDHLKEQRLRSGGSFTVAVNRPWPQRLAWRTKGVGYHWLTGTTTLDDLRIMVDELGVQEVLIFPGVEPEFLVDQRFEEQFEQVMLLPYRKARPPPEAPPADAPETTEAPDAREGPRGAGVREVPDAPELPAKPEPDHMVKVYRPLRSP